MQPPICIFGSPVSSVSTRVPRPQRLARARTRTAFRSALRSLRPTQTCACMVLQINGARSGGCGPLRILLSMIGNNRLGGRDLSICRQLCFCIHPRRDVLLERISQSFSPARILSSHRFFTTRATFEERFTPLLAPALFLAMPFLVLPLLPVLPVRLPLLPGLPVRFPAERAPL